MLSKRTILGFSFGILMISVGLIAVPVTNTTSATIYTQNLALVYGTSTTDFPVYGINDNGDFETDSDIDTYIEDNVFYLYDNDLTLKDLTIDYLDCSIGKWTTDWTGTVGDNDDPASGGNYYALANASTPDESSATGDGITWSGLNKKTPPNSGYTFSLTGTNTESTENADTDSEARYWIMEDDLVDVEVTSTSYININCEVTFSGVNETKDTILILYAIFTDGLNQVAMGIIWDASVTDSTAWADGASTTITGSGTTEEDLVYLNQDVAAASTAEGFVGYYNIEDTLQNSAAYSTFSPTHMVEWGVQVSGVYSDETATIEVAQMTVVDDPKDFSLFESTDSDDTSADRSNNYPNATAQDISDWDEYSLYNGFAFALDDNKLPINRFTLSKYMTIYEPAKSEIVTVASSYVIREDTFDTYAGSDERITEPTTMYINISDYLDSSYYFSQMWIAGEEVFDDDLRLNSGYTFADKDSSPSFTEISDLSENLADWDSYMQIHHTDIDTVTNQLIFDIQFAKPTTESANTGTVPTSTAAGGLVVIGGVDYTFEAIVIILVLGGGVTIIYLWRRD